MRLRARPATRRLRRTITVAAAALLAAFGLAVAGGAGAAPAGAATSSCAAAYSVTNDWGTGFTAALTVTNNGTAAITGWTVTYSYTGNQALQPSGGPALARTALRRAPGHQSVCGAMPSR